MLMQNDSPFDEDKVTGTLGGLAVGDALGAPAEFKSRYDVRREFPHGMQEMRASGPWSAGEYTDDTQMALLLAESLLEKGRFDASNIARRFRYWSRSAKDVGIQIRRVTAMKDYELNPEECSRRDFIENPHKAAGNGAVMRSAPVALFHLFDESMLYADSRRSALVTHGDPKALTSCVMINAAVAHFIKNGDRDSPWRHGMENLIPDERAAWSRLESIASASEDSIHSNGYTVSSVEASFWCFARTESFEAAIELAASLGDDADTTAAITGALAGAYYGYQAIPERWRTKLLDCAHIRDLALRLARKGRETEAKDLGQPSEEALDPDRQEQSTPAAGLPMPDSGAAASPSEASFTDFAYLIDEHQRLHLCWDGSLTNAAIVGILESEWGSIAEIAAHRDWPNLMQMVDQYPDLVNAVYPKGRSWSTLLHWAVANDAPVSWIEELVHRGAFRTALNHKRQTPAELALRKGQHHLASILVPEIQDPRSEDALMMIQELFHGLVRAIMLGYGVSHHLRLPQLSALTERKDSALWFAVPGMMGGFLLWLHHDASNPALIARNWCRMGGDSGDCRRITACEVISLDDGGW